MNGFIQHSDMCLYTHSHAGGIGADHTAANDHNACSRYAGYTAEQHATAALIQFQCMGTGLNRHAAGHFAHRRQ